MNSSDIVLKTAKGAEEVKARSRSLPHRLRTMLILIDGTLNVEQLLEAAAKLGVPPDFLGTLEQQGLIAVNSSASDSGISAVRPEASEVERFRAAQKFMNDTVVDALGFRAFLFTLKLEKCFSRADLSALIDDYAKAITKGSGEEVARVLRSRARQLLT
jgi:hypothetical protein